VGKLTKLVDAAFIVRATKSVNHLYFSSRGRLDIFLSYMQVFERIVVKIVWCHINFLCYIIN